jgi:hypothetical protein
MHLISGFRSSRIARSLGALDMLARSTPHKRDVVRIYIDRGCQMRKRHDLNAPRKGTAQSMMIEGQCVKTRQRIYAVALKANSVMPWASAGPWKGRVRSAALGRATADIGEI